MNQDSSSSVVLTQQVFSDPALRPDHRNKILFVVLSLPVLYCLAHYLLGHLKPVHFFFSLVVLGLFFISSASRLFFLLGIPFILKDILFDGIRYIPFEWLQPIHVEGPYRWELDWFGVSTQGAPMLLNEYLLRFLNPVLDVVSALIYFLNEPVAILLIFLFWSLRSKELAERYSVAFLVMNLFAFLTYVFYPVAAPWYVAKYGLVTPQLPVLGDAAGLMQFDRIIGVPFAERIYTMSPVVFGAIPSMHAGFAMLGWIYSLRTNWKWATLLGVYTLLMSLSALYLQHHYVIDLLIGYAYAGLTYGLVEVFLAGGIGRLYRFLTRHLVHEGPRTLWK